VLATAVNLDAGLGFSLLNLVSAAVSAAVVRASRPHLREQDTLGTAGRMLGATKQ
jgi:hypothetical protein